MRLDQYCATSWPEYSRSIWQKYIAAGYVEVNGKPTTESKYALDENDFVKANIPKGVDFSQETLPVIYEDKNVIVINKPAGILTHAKGGINEEFTVADFVASRKDYHADTGREGIVHRLDRATSGVIIAAKNSETAALLSRQFQDRKVKKTYIAVVEGVPKEPKALLDLPIGRNPKKPSSFRIDPSGKSAQTSYEVIKYGKKYSLVRLEPRTGRTHQLRVHMTYIGTPIRGDDVYGKKASRLFLHAKELEITIPGEVSKSNQRKIFSAPVPDDFENEINS